MTHPTCDPFDPNCPTRQVLDRIAGKWAVLIVVALEPRAKRFGELRREVGGISQKMLTQTLRALEQHGLLVRRDYGEVPPRVDYTLTPLGASLSRTLAVLDEWVVANFSEVDAARRRYRRPRAPSQARSPENGIRACPQSRKHE